MNKDAPQIIRIAPSPRLRVTLVIAHLVAFASILLAAILPWLSVVLLLLVGASLARSRRPEKATDWRLYSDGRLEKFDADGVAQEIAVHSHSLALAWLVVLLYRQDGQLQSCVVLPDSLPAEDFRQLRVWLRCRA